MGGLQRGVLQKGHRLDTCRQFARRVEFGRDLDGDGGGIAERLARQQLHQKLARQGQPANVHFLFGARDERVFWDEGLAVLDRPVTAIATKIDRAGNRNERFASPGVGRTRRSLAVLAESPQVSVPAAAACSRGTRRARRSMLPCPPNRASLRVVVVRDEVREVVPVLEEKRRARRCFRTWNRAMAQRTQRR